MSHSSAPPGFRPHPYFDPFEDHVGPFWLSDEGGELRFAFRASKKHCNTGGTVHGGLLVTFADFALCAAGCWQRIEEERCVTVSLDTQFLDTVHEGELVLARADVLRTTRRMVFVRGLLEAGERPVLAFSGVARRFERGNAR